MYKLFTDIHEITVGQWDFHRWATTQISLPNGEITVSRRNVKNEIKKRPVIRSKVKYLFSAPSTRTELRYVLYDSMSRYKFILIIFMTEHRNYSTKTRGTLFFHDMKRMK